MTGLGRSAMQLDLVDDDPAVVARVLGGSVIRPRRVVGTIDQPDYSLPASVDPLVLSFIVRVLPPPGTTS